MNLAEQFEMDEKYEEAYAELQTIVRKMENDELDIDQMTEQLKRAQQLIKLCGSPKLKPAARQPGSRQPGRNNTRREYRRRFEHRRQCRQRKEPGRHKL